MIHKIYTEQWIVLVVGIVFLFISIYTLFRGVKRDKIIAISSLSFCMTLYIVGEIRIRSHNEKAKIYIGTYQLAYYNNSEDYRIEIFPDNRYIIFNSIDTVVNGEWQLSISEDNSTRLLLDGSIFGIGEYKLK